MFSVEILIFNHAQSIGGLVALPFAPYLSDGLGETCINQL